MQMIGEEMAPEEGILLEYSWLHRTALAPYYIVEVRLLHRVVMKGLL